MPGVPLRVVCVSTDSRVDLYETRGPAYRRRLSSFRMVISPATPNDTDCVDDFEVSVVVDVTLPIVKVVMLLDVSDSFH